MRWFAALTSSRDIAAVRKRGVRLSGRTMHGYATLGRSSARIAIAVSKTVGNAVVRNRIRRRLRGALEDRGGPAGLDLLLVVRPEAAVAGYAALSADLEVMLARLERRPG